MKPEELLKSKTGLLRLTLSIFAVQFMSILVNNIDQLMISHYSQTAVAAVGNANQISWVLMLLFQILCMSSVILITQYKGAGDKTHEQQIYAVSLALNTAISLVIGIVCLLCGHYILRLMNVTDPAVERDAYIYLAVTGGASVFTSAMLTYSSFFRGNAMMREAMIVSMSVNILNIIGNWLLIYGVGPFPSLGVLGVAISTALSRVAGTVILALVFGKRVSKIDFGLLRPFPFDQLRKLLRLGVPAAGESLSYDLSQLVIMGFVNTLGLVAVNTKIYVALVAQTAYIFTNALGEATQVAEGYLLGSKRHDEAHKRVMKSLRIGIMCSLVLTFILYLSSDAVLGLFLTSGSDTEAMRAEVLSLGKKIFVVELFLEFGRALNLIIVKALQGAGDTVFPAVMCVITSWLLATAGGWLLSIHFGLGLVGIWIGMSADECIRGFILIGRWLGGRWRGIDLVENSAANDTAQ